MRSARVIRFLSLAILVLLVMPLAAQADPVHQVSPATLTGGGLISFEDVVGAPSPGTSYDGLMGSGGALIAERFVAQALSYSGDFDVLSGLPGNPLTLQTGDPGQNVLVFETGSGKIALGLGAAGYPSFDALGEGSVAVLFDAEFADSAQSS